MNQWTEAIVLSLIGLVTLYIAWSLRRLVNGWDSQLEEHRRRLAVIEDYLEIDTDTQTLPLKRKNGA